MASGPEHYAEAEKLLRGTYVPDAVRHEFSYDGKPSPEDVAKALVHAQLAVAAATADAAMQWDGAIRNDLEWGKVTS